MSRLALVPIGRINCKSKNNTAYGYIPLSDNRQRRMGPRAPETEKIHEEFTVRKLELEVRLKSLRAALTDAERLNKALKVGRVPSMVVSVLQTLEDAGLGQHFTVVGTHALYAYETAAGVRIVTDLGKLDSSMLRVLQRADPTFLRKEGQAETAINAKGFEVDFLRRQPEGDDPHPFRFSDDEDDLWPVQAVRASVLTNAPRFEHVIISATGRMTLMRTIAPESFVEFKRWIDQHQADIVQALLDEGLLMSQAPATALGSDK